MKKILTLIIFFAFFLLVNKTNANWYGNTPIGYSNGNITSCPSDGNTVGGSNPTYGEAAVTGGAGSLTPIGSRTSVASSGVMYCIKWDASKPTNPTSLTYTISNSDGSSCNNYNGTNFCKTSTVNINANWSGAGDQGGSGIKDYDIIIYNASNGVNVNQRYVSGTSNSFSISLTNSTRYGIKIRTRDNALNINDIYYYPSTNFFIDTTPPTTSDLVNISNFNSTNFLANNSLSYIFNVNQNGGAPIIQINARSEKSDNSGYDARNSTNNTIGINWDISRVDNDRSAYGGREYSFLIDRICDAAGNCYNGGYEKKHFVYANTNSITKTITENTLDDNLVADGTDRNLTIRLVDNYGNKIVPASGISRNIDMKFNSVTNTMFLNQYSRDPSGTKSVDVIRANSSTNVSSLFGGGNALLNNEYSTNGDYVYKFKFYTPTANSYSASTYTVSDPSAEFVIGNIAFDVTGSLGARTNEVVSGSPITAEAKSLYNTSITGDIDDNGLRAQTYQNGNITLNKEPGNNPTSGSVKFKFTDNSGKYTLTYGGGNLVSENDTLTYYKNINPLFSDDIKTYLKLDNSPAPSTTAGYFSTHISYIIDGKSVILNSDVIGRDSYHGTTNTVDLVQSGLKVVGNIYDKDSKEVVEGQEITSLGTIEKIDIKSDVVAQAYNFAKEVTYNQSTDGIIVDSIFGSTGGGKRVGKVIYFGDVDNNGAGKIYQLGSGSDINVNDTKTILVIGGDLYIKSNMYYSLTGDYNLGIVVLKDKAGNGGKVYIDPGVTNIVGTIFAEKALISYDGTNELDGNADASALKNQLHIYGSVFSYNTIGGSSLSPLKCPYFETTCDLPISFKYDLNYLRRYFLTKDGNTYYKPAYDGKVSGGGTYNGNGNITGNNTNYARNITTTTDPYAKYSVIIEYNPTLKSVIPPFFNQR